VIRATRPLFCTYWAEHEQSKHGLTSRLAEPDRYDCDYDHHVREASDEKLHELERDCTRL